MSKNGKIDVVNYRIGKKKYNLTWHAKLIAEGEEQKALEKIMEKADISKEEAEKVVEDLKLYNKQVEEKKSKPKSKLPLIIAIIVVLLLAGGGYLVYQKMTAIPEEAIVAVEADKFDYNVGEYQDASIWIARGWKLYDETPADKWYAPELSNNSSLGVLMYKNNEDKGSFLKVTPTFECYVNAEGTKENGYASILGTYFDVKAMTMDDFEKEVQNCAGKDSALTVNKMNESCMEAAYQFLNTSPKTAEKTNDTYNIQEYLRANEETWAEAYANHGITTKTNSIDFIGATLVEYDYDNEYATNYFTGEEPLNHASFIYQEMNMDNFDRDKDHVFACFYKANVTTTEMESEVAGLNFIPAKGESKDVYVVITGVFDNKGNIAEGKGGVCGIEALYDEDLEYSEYELNPNPDTWDELMSIDFGEYMTK